MTPEMTSEKRQLRYALPYFAQYNEHDAFQNDKVLQRYREIIAAAAMADIRDVLKSFSMIGVRDSGSQIVVAENARNRADFMVKVRQLKNKLNPKKETQPTQIRVDDAA